MHAKFTVESLKLKIIFFFSFYLFLLLLFSALYTKYGPRWSWNIEIAIITFTLCLWFLLRKRMVPLNVPDVYAEFQDQNDPDIKKKINVNNKN